MSAIKRRLKQVLGSNDIDLLDSDTAAHVGHALTTLLKGSIFCHLLERAVARCSYKGSIRSRLYDRRARHANRARCIARNPHGRHRLAQGSEDILLVVDGREELVAEIQNADDDVRCYIAEKFIALLGHEDFDHFLEGNIKGPEGRVVIVPERFVAISQSDAGE